MAGGWLVVPKLQKMYGWLDSPAPAIGKSIGPGLGDWATIEELFWYRPINLTLEEGGTGIAFCQLRGGRKRKRREKMVWWL